MNTTLITLLNENKRKNVLLRIGKVIGIITLVILAYFLGNKTATVSTAKTSVSKPYYSKVINKDFSFPIKDDKGNEIAIFTYTIQSVQLQNEIILKGEKADSVEGRTFLLINLKINNPTNQTMQLNSRDFIRLSVDNSPEHLAPEIHNDPVEIQAISTKYTRLAMPVDENIKKVTLYIGDINGEKTPLTIIIH